MPRTVLITGTSSGIGRASAKYFAEQGWNVVATMRRPSCEAGQELSKLENVLVVALDVTSDSSVKEGVDAALAKFGTIDVLVNNAGYGVSGPLEAATMKQVERQFGTNVLGPIRVMQAVLPTMRAARSGVILNIGSVVGVVSIPLMSLYVSTKFAVEGLSESAAMELAPFGIKVRIVEPGAVRTQFSTTSLDVASSDTIRDYDTMSANMGAKFPSLVAAGSDVPEITKVVYEAATFEGDKIRFVAGKDAVQWKKDRREMTDEEHHKYSAEKFDISL